MSTNQRVLSDLDYNLVVIPPKRTSFTAHHLIDCPIEYHDLIAIDIAILPDQAQSQWIINQLNKPLLPFGSFPLDESHFPHMSLCHTIVPRSVLAQLCSELHEICTNFDFVLSHWYSLLQSRQHPLYSYQDNTTDAMLPPLIIQKQCPHITNMERDQILKDFINTCPNLTAPSISSSISQSNNAKEAINQKLSSDFTCKSYYKQLFSINPTTTPATVTPTTATTIPHTFDWTIVSSGPMWAGDTTLPYVGYPNPLLTDQLMTNQANDQTPTTNGRVGVNGLNMRLLHDIVTLMMHPYRVSIWEAKPKLLEQGGKEEDKTRDEKDRRGVERSVQIDIKAIQTNGNDATLDAICNVLYYSGQSITPTSICSSTIANVDGMGMMLVDLSADGKKIDQTNNDPMINTAGNNDDNGTSITLIQLPLPPQQYQPIFTSQQSQQPQQPQHPPLTHRFYTPNPISAPFNHEPGDISTLKYSNAFDESYMGHKYNPHITIGSGEAGKVRDVILAATIGKGDQVDDNNNQQEGQKKRQEDGTEPKPFDQLPNPIPMDLSTCTIGVFQLGRNGSCRFPIFKTKICPSSPLSP